MANIRRDVHVVNRQADQFDSCFKRLKTVGRRMRMTPELVVINQLNLMSLENRYELYVKRAIKAERHRLTDYKPQRPSPLMKEGDSRYVGVCYGPYLDRRLYTTELIEFQDTVVERIRKELDFDNGIEVVFAGVLMFGELWGSGSVVY